MRPGRGARQLIAAVGGPHDGNLVLVYEPIPLERVIDRCTYVLDEVGTPAHPGPVYVYVSDDWDGRLNTAFSRK